MLADKTFLQCNVNICFTKKPHQTKTARNVKNNKLHFTFKVIVLVFFHATPHKSALLFQDSKNHPAQAYFEYFTKESLKSPKYEGKYKMLVREPVPLTPESLRKT